MTAGQYVMNGTCLLRDYVATVLLRGIGPDPALMMGMAMNSRGGRK